MRVIYPGTFDPVTNGHIDIAQRASQLFDEVVVAVVEQSVKRTAFSGKQRLELMGASLSDMPNVNCVLFSGLLVEFAQSQGVRTVIRGLRRGEDFEYEYQLANTNRCLSPTIETVFLPCSTEHAFLSSSLVREVAALGGDISAFVPREVVDAYHQKRMAE